MLHISLVVAVPVSQLRAVPRKGNKLLLHWLQDLGLTPHMAQQIGTNRTEKCMTIAD